MRPPDQNTEIFALRTQILTSHLDFDFALRLRTSHLRSAHASTQCMENLTASKEKTGGPNMADLAVAQELNELAENQVAFYHEKYERLAPQYQKNKTPQQPIASDWPRGLV